MLHQRVLRTRLSWWRLVKASFFLTQLQKIWPFNHTGVTNIISDRFICTLVAAHVLQDHLISFPYRVSPVSIWLHPLPCVFQCPSTFCSLLRILPGFLSCVYLLAFLVLCGWLLCVSGFLWLACDSSCAQVTTGFRFGSVSERKSENSDVFTCI